MRPSLRLQSCTSRSRKLPVSKAISEPLPDIVACDWEPEVGRPGVGTRETAPVLGSLLRSATKMSSELTSTRAETKERKRPSSLSDGLSSNPPDCTGAGRLSIRVATVSPAVMPCEPKVT